MNCEEVPTLFPELRSLQNAYGPTVRRVMKGYETRLLRQDIAQVDPLLALLMERAA